MSQGALPLPARASGASLGDKGDRLSAPAPGEEPLLSLMRMGTAAKGKKARQGVVARIEPLDFDVLPQLVEDAEGQLRAGGVPSAPRDKPLHYAADLVGQTLAAATQASRRQQQHQRSSKNERFTMMDMRAWEKNVLWSSPNDEDDDHAPLLPPLRGSGAASQHAPSPSPLTNGDVEWEDSDAVPKVTTRDPLKVEATVWEEALDSQAAADAADQAQQSVQAERRRLTQVLSRLARNELLSSNAWLNRVVFDDDDDAVERSVAMDWSPLRPHPLDEAFLVDAIQRAVALQAVAEANNSSSVSASASSNSMLPPPPPPETPSLEASADSLPLPPPPPPSSSSSSAMVPGQPPPPPPPPPPPARKSTNPPGRGPPRKELMSRRFNQYGHLLTALGVYDEVPVVVTPTPKPVEEEEAPGWKSAVPPVRHFEPTYDLEFFSAQLPDLDPLKTYHRPLTSHRDALRVKVLTDVSEMELARLAVGVRVDGLPSSSDSSALLRKADLTVRDGKVFLFEYAERFPLVLNSVGMMSNVLNFYRGPNPPPGELPKVGIPVALEANEPSPLSYPVKPGRVYRVMQNTMAHATLFEHAPVSTDFLLVRTRGQQDQVLIRKINGMFVVGQVEPQMEIYTPSDNHIARTPFTRWIENYMAFHFAGMMLKREDLRIMYTTAEKMFRYAPDSLLQRVLRQVAEPSVGPAPMVKKPWCPLGTIEFPDKELHEFKRDLMDRRRDLVSRELRPDEACLWESLQLGLERLRQAGVEHVARIEVPMLLEAFRVYFRLHQLRLKSLQAAKRDKEASLPEDARKRLAAVRYVLRECQLTPWWLSTCFWWLHLNSDRSANPFPPDMVMRVSGLGDPSGRGEAVSYLPRYDRGSGGALDEEDEAYIDPADGKTKIRTKSGAPKPQYERTDADLRLLSMVDLGVILERIGIPKDDIAPITRWDRTWIIEQVASSAKGQYMLNGEIAKYARQGTSASSINALGEKRKVNVSQAHYVAFKEHLDRVYERQAAALSSVEVVAKANNVEAIDDDDLIEWAGAIQQGLSSESSFRDGTSLSQLEEAEREKKEMEDLMRAAKERREQQSRRPENHGSSSLVGASAAQQHVPKPVLKRTIIEVLPNGVERIRVEYHRNPDTIRAWKSKVASTPAPAPPRMISQLEKAKALQREQQQSEFQKRHKEWYMQQMAQFGENFWESYVENDPRLPETMPKRGQSKPQYQLKPGTKIARCTLCHLPGHGQQSPLCPLQNITGSNNVVKFDDGPTKLRINKKELSNALSSSAGGVSPAAKRVKVELPTASAELIQRLLQVHQAVISDPRAASFLAVNANPDYQIKVTEPIDLSLIMDKVKAGMYVTPEHYVSDLQGLVDNSTQFHGSPDNVSTVNARALVDLARQALSQSSAATASSAATGSGRGAQPGKPAKSLLNMDALFGSANTSQVAADDDFYGSQTSSAAAAAAAASGVEEGDVEMLEEEQDNELGEYDEGDAMVQEGEEEELLVEEGDEEEFMPAEEGEAEEIFEEEQKEEGAGEAGNTGAEGDDAGNDEDDEDDDGMLLDKEHVDDEA